jgi:hypothetical protein
MISVGGSLSLSLRVVLMSEMVFVVPGEEHSTKGRRSVRRTATCLVIRWSMFLSCRCSFRFPSFFFSDTQIIIIKKKNLFIHTTRF